MDRVELIIYMRTLTKKILKRGLFQRKGTKRGPHFQKGSPRGPGDPLGEPPKYIEMWLCLTPKNCFKVAALGGPCTIQVWNIQDSPAFFRFHF